MKGMGGGEGEGGEGEGGSEPESLASLWSNDDLSKSLSVVCDHWTTLHTHSVHPLK